MERKILPRINKPEDIQGLTLKELKSLSGEIRDFITENVTVTGGHLASNLGIVEITVALHRVFQSPRDKFIWDVGHQSYPHKILTGRGDQFSGLRQKGGISGFPRRKESPHDIMDTGHASTSLSSGLGILVGQELLNQEGYVIPVIGDGALTGGMAWEALSHAGHLGKRLIVILNDNNMSINANVGAFSTYLSRLTATEAYQRFRRRADRGMIMIPLIGRCFYRAIHRIKRGFKALVFKETLFSDFGFQYVGPVDGHNLGRMISLFEDLKRVEKPVVVHVLTRKGKGNYSAEDDPASFHGIPPKPTPGEDPSAVQPEAPKPATYTQAFGKALAEMAAENPRLAAVTAAMTSGTGLKDFAAAYPDRFFDVSISEQHGVTFAAGLAVAGMRPVAAIYSTFMQRAVDQVIHDVAIPQLPVIFCMDRSGLVPADGETHQGVYDIPLFRSVPHLKILSPATEGEMEAMLRYAAEQPGPVMIRFAKDRVLPEMPGALEPLEEGRGVFLKQEQGDILFVSLGALAGEALKAAEILEEQGIEADVYNLRFIKPLNWEALVRLFSLYTLVVVAEDGARSGGVGECLASLVEERRIDTEYRYLGVPDTFMPAMTRPELLEECGLSADRMVEAVHGFLREQRIQGVVQMFREKGTRKKSL